ncbi:hypothetical protein Egran_05974, partial [Elaphomyces granulatus]
METNPFRVEPDLVRLVDEMNDEDLRVFADLQDDPASDSQIELHIYTCLTVFTRSNSTEHLELAVQRAEGLVAVTPDNHADRARRLEILDMLSFKMWQTRQISVYLEAKSLIDQAVILTENYKRTGTVKDLDIAINMAEQAINSTQPGHADRENMFFKLSIMRGLRYERKEDVDDLKRAVEAAEEAVSGTPPDHPARAARLSNLGIRLSRKFEKMGSMEDIDRAIKLTDIAVDATPLNDLSRPSRLHNLSHQLNMRFEKTNSIEDINRAIIVTQMTLDATPVDNANRASILAALGIMLGLRFEKLGTIEDFTKSVKFTKAAVESTPLEDSQRPLRLHHLGKLLSQPVSATETTDNLDQLIEVADIAVEVSPMVQGDEASTLMVLGELLMTRFERRGIPSDIDRAIDVAGKALDITSLDNPEVADRLNTLGHYLGTRFQITGMTKDLDRAVEVTEMAVEATSVDHSAWVSGLRNLGNWFGLRFNHAGSIEDLHRAIEVSDMALNMAGDGYPDRASLLTTVGTWLGKRFDLAGKMEDLHRAIKVSEIAVDTASPNYLDRGSLLLNLANRLGRRFEQTGLIEDLNRAIELTSESTDCIPDSSPEKALSLSNLGLWLSTRFRHAGAMEDINDAINAADMALEITHVDHPQLPDRLATVGKLRGIRFDRTQVMEDINRSIEALDTVAALTLDHPNRAHFLNYLGICHHKRFDHTREMKDLNVAIEVTTLAVESKSLHHLDQVACLVNLGVWLSSRFGLTEEMDDLDRAIETVDRSLKANPLNQPDQADSWNIFGLLLTMRFERTGAIEDRMRAESSFREGWNCPNTPPSTRIHIARNLAVNLTRQLNWEDSNTFLQDAVQLLPTLSSWSLQNTDKHQKLPIFFGLASMAAAVALNAGKEPSDALKLLELGRGIVAGQLLEMRTDISELDSKYPELAKEFLSLREELDAPIGQGFVAAPSDTIASRESRAKRRREAEKRFDRVIKVIRTRSGFENFLLPSTADQFMAAANAGPIVVINVSHYRCDAFLVERHRIRALKLSDLRLEDIQEKAKLLRRNEESEAWEVLEWLWEVAACPILEALDIKNPPTDCNWPHVWWVLTGQLNQLPLHAAGKHFEGSGETVLDRAISSYSLSVKALIYGRQHTLLEPGKPDDALLVSMPKTIGQSPLYFAQEEVDMLEKLCPSLRLNPVKPLQRRNDVLTHLPTCKIFHFAGHGHSDLSEPSQSCLLLDDWETSLLTVAELREHKLQEKPPFLAYLSACSTGAHDVVEFTDEGIHLISACQLAGFRHVIGTLWEVNDWYCVHVAKTVYETIRDEGMTDTAVCLGLHRAVRSLRDEYIKNSSMRGSRSRTETDAVRAEDAL